MRLAIALLLSVLGCGCDSRRGPAAAAACTHAGAGAFAAPCASACDCASGMCFTFGDGTKACTISCSGAEQCPAGSQGRKCNRQGACRP